MSEWQRLGPIVKCQIHTDRMVNDGVYQHELLTDVDELWVGVDGVVGVQGPTTIMHAHHRLHPNKVRGPSPRRFLPARLLSIGFTSHYAAMADRFGEATLGCAAEDLIVDCAEVVTLDMLAGGLQVRSGHRVVDLDGAAVAKPCVPFTKFMLDDADADDELVASERAFLEDGMRGFVLGLADHDTPQRITVGDELWARS